jgi:hypothetical protein
VYSGKVASVDAAVAGVRRWLERVTAGGAEEPGELDAVIEVGRQALSTGPVTGNVLHRMLALAHQERWNRDRADFHDAECAIELWRHVLDQEPADAGVAFFCGALVAHRAERTRDPADIVEAVRLASLAAHGLDDGESWYLLGWAHVIRAFIGAAPDGSTEALRCFAVALRRDPDDDLLARITREQVRAASSLRERGELPQDQFRAHLDRGFAVLDTPGAATAANRALLAGTLAMVELGAAEREGRAHDFARIRALVSEYDGADLSDPHLRAELDAARAKLSHFVGGGDDLDRGVATVTRLASSDRFSAEQREVIAEHLAMMRAGRAAEQGDLNAFEAALDQFRTGSTGADDESANRWPGAILAALFDARRLAEEGDDVGAVAVLAGARRLLPDGPQTARLQDILAAIESAVPGSSADPPTSRSTTAAARVPESGRMESPIEAAMRTMELTVELSGAAANGDLAALRRIAASAAGLPGRIPDSYAVLKVSACSTAGVAELEVARRDPADHAAAARATTHLAAACALAGGPHHALWPRLAVDYGYSLRLGARPDPPESRRLGRSALLALGWQALVQADAGRALESVSGAGRIVRTVAAWCADDAGNDTAAAGDLVAALDTGRGLALHAASASRSMPERLAAAGHADLAATWRFTAGQGHDPDDNLRVRALHALTADSDLFASADPAEVRRALTTVGADALVYLVPAEGTRPGMAVLVPVAEGVRVLPLPDLHAGRAPAGWAVAGRDLTPTAAASGDDFDELCRWAWSACIGPLVDFTQRWQLYRPARLVLVPTNALSLIPWHAASYEDGAGRHYAIERLVISYSVSARMFCSSAGHALRRPQSALIVGDPGGDLPYAADEARTIHRDFYPRGTLLDSATADDVLNWISMPERRPSMVHLACHGHVDPAQPAQARLALAGGDLPVLHLLAQSRSAGLELDRVVLSACSTGAIGSLYDEAVSLATAFLAGGAHTVFGSLWAVPDADTARLMYALHHHLSVDGLAPVDALRRAQLGILNPTREPPPGLPPELVATGAGGPCSWSAFIHLGR